MFRTVKLFAVALALVAMSAAVQARPDDKPKDKEVTIKGETMCAKCELKKSDKCATVVRAKEDGKEVLYYFDAASHKKYHGEACTEVKEATVTGKVSEKDGKKWIAVSKIDFKKKT
jgi:hypothetical protein